MRKTFFVAATWLVLFNPRPSSAQESPATADAADPAPEPRLAYLDKSKIIYVSEFETANDSRPATAAGNDESAIPGSGGQARTNGSAGAPAEQPAGFAKLLEDAVVHELKKAGYKARPLGLHDVRPEDGILISGIFTELGKDGALLPAAIGPSPTDVGIQLYVTSSNLLRTAKPLYGIAHKGKGGEPRNAPIVLNPEVATLKFPIAKNSTEKVIKKTAEQITAALVSFTAEAESQGLTGSGDPLNKYSKP
jgi:hypothetical protein